MRLKTVLIAILLVFTPFSIAATLWIDVRTPAEYQSDSITGDVNLPLAELADAIGSVTDDKSAAISLYCRSGRRAELAKEVLVKLGYSNVSNVGGISDARQIRGISAP